MERTNKVNAVRREGNDVTGPELVERLTQDVRALADLELALVGGGDAGTDWGG
jgi:hypothetical protein